MVDRIIPSVPVRQWVLSLPFDLRANAAFDARVLTSVIRAFARAWARGVGFGASEFGAITFVQRFGGSLIDDARSKLVAAGLDQWVAEDD